MSEFKPKQPVLLTDLVRFERIDKVVVESIEQALFRLEVEVAGEVYYVTESPGRSLTRRSILEIQELLTPFTIDSMYLRHTSPYDEMIGLEANPTGNELLVPLGNYFADAPKQTRH